jgi:translation initiation factor IF-3
MENGHRSAGKDLVMITEKAQIRRSPKSSTLAKYKYQQQQKDAESRKKAKAQDIKEVRFKPFMSDERLRDPACAK